MGDPYLYPKLRYPIDISLERASETEDALLIRCPRGISPTPLVLLAATAPIIACFEGNMSVDDIVKKFSGYGIRREIILELVRLLDESLFLATPRFFAAEKEMQEEYRRSDVRKAALAGLSYPDDRESLTKLLDTYLESNSGVEVRKNPLSVLISPHIDYRRGGVTYGRTYRHLRSDPNTLYIVIGTSHQYSPYMFHLTRKHFDSPFGAIATDTEFVTKLAERYGSKRSFADEILHKQEHSLELQIPFMGRVRSNFSIVPILVGGFYRMLSSGKKPGDFEEYQSFAGALAEVARDAIANGKKVAFIAGVDMAHVGRAFGDDFDLSDEFMKEIEVRDKHYLDVVLSQDKEALFNHVAEDADARRICGFPTMYTILDVLDRLNSKGTSQLFEYRQAVDSERACGVTFAGGAIYQ